MTTVATQEREFKECFDCTEAVFGLDDNGAPVLRNCKVLGTISQNDREYTLEAKTNGLALYENAKVNINHPSDPHKSRDFQDRFGFIRSPRIENRDIYGDLYFNPEHPWAKTVAWWAKNAPECLGLSHNAVGQGRDDNGRFIVEKIVKVRSVDLVADPATTKSLFEAINYMAEPTKVPAPVEAPKPAVTVPVTQLKEDSTPPNPVATQGGDGSMSTPQSMHEKIGHLVSEIVKDTTIDRASKRRKLLTATKLLPENDADEEGEKVKEPEKPAEKKPESDEKKEKADAEGEKVKTEESKVEKPTAPNLTELSESVMKKLGQSGAKAALELDALKSKKKYLDQLAKAKVLCKESKLPDTLVTNEFLRNLAEATDEKGMKALIEDRLILINVPKPVPPKDTTAKKPDGKKLEVKDFVEAVSAN